MSEWSTACRPRARPAIDVLSEPRRRRRRRVAWVGVAVWGGTIVLCLATWALVAWAIHSYVQ